MLQERLRKRECVSNQLRAWREREHCNHPLRNALWTAQLHVTNVNCQACCLPRLVIGDLDLWADFLQSCDAVLLLQHRHLVDVQSLAVPNQLQSCPQGNCLASIVAQPFQLLQCSLSLMEVLPQLLSRKRVCWVEGVHLVNRFVTVVADDLGLRDLALPLDPSPPWLCRGPGEALARTTP